MKINLLLILLAHSQMQQNQREQAGRPLLARSHMCIDHAESVVLWQAAGERRCKGGCTTTGETDRSHSGNFAPPQSNEEGHCGRFVL